MQRIPALPNSSASSGSRWRYESFAAITGRQTLKALQKAGFTMVRTRGSHRFLRHPDGRVTVVPIHGGETIGPGLLNQILKDAEIERDDFNRLL